MNFEACSAFTHVTACTLAESPLRPSSTGGFSSFVTSTAAPIATGRNEPVPGWDLHPLWTKRLSRRTRTISLVGYSDNWQLVSNVPSTCPFSRLVGNLPKTQIALNSSTIALPSYHQPKIVRRYSKL